MRQRYDNESNNECWLRVIKQRAITDWNTTPLYIKKKVERAIEIILSSFPQVNEIYLVGSYVHGHYRDEHTEPDLLDYLLTQGGCEGMSDLDFATDKNIVEYNIGGERIDIIGHHSLYDRKTLVHSQQKGETK